ncbi:MAG: LacI family DNA-binding transcriptional regulator [Erysipelotrichaceae bacterium]|nr:LacI family DNA-binding transcriptional regulator [Erysipelotrichaceae bacterium]
MAENITSIKDIARLSGVSIATVSRILNKKGGYSKETEQKILSLCEQYNFTLNQSAQSLKIKKTNTIGLILPNIQNPFYALMASYVENELSALGYSTLICDAFNQTEKEKVCFATLIAKGVDGILCASGLPYIDDTIITKEIPVVLIDRHPDNDFGFPVVMNNELESSESATSYLIEEGCRNILLINGFSNQYKKLARIDGYVCALYKHDIPFQEHYILRRPGKQPSHIEIEVLLNQFLEEGHPVDGILATSERSALGALQALRSRNIRIPEDVKIVSYDNTICSILTSPTLSSLERHPDLVAKEACRMLTEMIDGTDHRNEAVYIPTDLIRRQSSAKK